MKLKFYLVFVNLNPSPFLVFRNPCERIETFVTRQYFEGIKMCAVNQSVNATTKTPTETYEYNGADMVWVSISTCLVFIEVRIFLNH